jgi:hypothetical protein
MLSISLVGFGEVVMDAIGESSSMGLRKLLRYHP